MPLAALGDRRLTLSRGWVERTSKATAARRPPHPTAEGQQEEQGLAAGAAEAPGPGSQVEGCVDGQETVSTRSATTRWSSHAAQGFHSLRQSDSIAPQPRPRSRASSTPTRRWRPSSWVHHGPATPRRRTATGAKPGGLAPHTPQRDEKRLSCHGAGEFRISPARKSADPAWVPGVPGGGPAAWGSPGCWAVLFRPEAGNRVSLCIPGHQSQGYNVLRRAVCPSH